MQYDIGTKESKLAITLNGKDLKKGVKFALNRTAQQAVNIILDKTESGADLNDARFKPYTASYKRWREGRGKSATPNLFNTGKMLSAITSRVVNDKQAVVFFTSAAESKKAAFNQKKRPFFGLSKKTKKELEKFFIRNLT